ncbi:nucleotidyltransferase family protein [Metabacillus litoralis]|uniref:Nucleotidyltransferase family protein n=1 Tax=Metabacillus litoralis TaxID=152268 RepID=A0A5C6W4M3_9BACI|nr:nucleotidyltransferase family protein [Metabacillus litoralis]TXC92346.1 nucleotidyltransferase family protein [Metabacillus litoralis]
MIREFINNIYSTSSNLSKINEEQYKLIEEDISFFNIEPQIYRKVIDEEKLEVIPDFFRTSLKKIYQKQFINNMFIKNQTDAILSVLEDNKLSVIVLKGPLYAEKYFGDFSARPSSDIDLLIKIDEVDEVLTCIKKLGYINEEKNDEDHFHRTFSKPIPGSPVPLLVEIHWNLVRENTSKLPINQIWEETVLISGYDYVKQLSSFHTFYFIILHAWRHNLDSMKHFIDIIQMIHMLRNEINYELLFKVARKHKTFKRIKRTLSIVYQQFPHLNQVLELPFKKKKYGSFWQYEAFRGNKADKGKLYLDFIDYQFGSYDTFFHQMISLYEWLFPSKFGLEVELKHNRLSYLQLFKQRGKGLYSSLLIKRK